VGEKPKYVWGESAHHDVVRMAGDIDFASQVIIYNAIESSN